MDNSNYDERSAGGIVYRLIGNQIHWLLIKTLAKKTLSRLGGVGHKTAYKFPKGHLLPNESLKPAALREVEEEGGVNSKIVAKIGSNDYILWDKNSGTKIIKKVTFFLMEYQKDSSLKYSDREIVLKREWLTLEEALKKLSYNSEKILLKKAASKLNSLLKTNKSVKY